MTTTFPYMQIAKRHGYDYGVILSYVDFTVSTHRGSPATATAIAAFHCIDFAIASDVREAVRQEYIRRMHVRMKMMEITDETE